MFRISRRTFLQTTTAVGALSSRPSGIAQAQGSVGPVVGPIEHPKFVNNLRRPRRIQARTPQRLVMSARGVRGWTGLVDEAGNRVETTSYGYGLGLEASTPGPTIIAERDVPLEVEWRNDLPLGHILPVDLSLHVAEAENLTFEAGGVPIVTHLHGGHTEWQSDGETEAWYTQDYTDVGPTFVRQFYQYENSQEAAHLWYHDHALGITRLNVLAGLFGNYLLRDQNEANLIAEGILPEPQYEYELTLQDRDYDPDGSIAIETVPTRFPDGPPITDDVPNPSQVTISIGDYSHVNGQLWPVLEVEPRKYRFRVLNGNLWRSVNMGFLDVTEIVGPDEDPVTDQPELLGREEPPLIPYWVIGTDGGFLPEVVQIGDQLLLDPGERADIIVDFNGLDGRTIRLISTTAPGGGLGPGANDRYMQFVVGDSRGGEDASFNTIAVTTEEKTDVRRAPLPAWVDNPVDRVFRVGLFAGGDQFNRMLMLQGNLSLDEFYPDLDLGSRTWMDPVTEAPRLGETTVFEVWNLSAMPHPVHFHLVEFVVEGLYDPYDPALTGLPGRPTLSDPEPLPVETKAQALHHGNTGTGQTLSPTFDWTPYGGGVGTLPELTDAMRIGTPLELQGLKDTVVLRAYGRAGSVARFKMVFDKPGRYVWHCHLLSHEDHEMMRPLLVLAEGETPFDYENYGDIDPG